MKTREIMKNAHNAGGLKHGDSGDCLVGHLINKCNGRPINDISSFWYYDLIDNFRMVTPMPKKNNYFNTGYSAYEINIMESIFEKTRSDKTQATIGVFTYLCKIHKIGDFRATIDKFSNELVVLHQ